KVEAESARQFVDPSRPPLPKGRPADARPWNEPPPPPRAREPRPGEPRAREEGDPSRRYVNPPAAAPRADSAPKPRPPTPPGPRQSNSIFDRPLASEAQALRQPPRRPAGEPRPDSGRRDFRDVVAEANELGGASARAEKSAREAYAAVPDVDRS